VVKPRLLVWIDAQLPPALARWLGEHDDVDAVHLFSLGLISASDVVIFDAARAAGAVVMTKDVDFVLILERLGPPPQIVWVTTGNLSNRALRALIAATWAKTSALLHAGARLVELGEPRS
jgi:predicted nuclease of predicted toxin-antitoxin system